MLAWRGNEMSFGVSLAVWLALTGVGGLAFGPVARRVPRTPLVLAGSALTLLGDDPAPGSYRYLKGGPAGPRRATAFHTVS